MDIKTLQKEVYALAKSKGWHRTVDKEIVVSRFAEEILELVCLEASGAGTVTEDMAKDLVRRVVEWGPKLMTPEEKTPQMLINIVGEVSEAWEEFRANKKPTETYYETDKNGNQKPLGIPTEIADVVIRCFDTAEALGFDLEDAVLKKHAYNATRDVRHGGKRA